MTEITNTEIKKMRSKALLRAVAVVGLTMFATISLVESQHWTELAISAVAISLVVIMMREAVSHSYVVHKARSIGAKETVKMKKSTVKMISYARSMLLLGVFVQTVAISSQYPYLYTVEHMFSPATIFVFFSYIITSMMILTAMEDHEFMKLVDKKKRNEIPGEKQ